MLKKEVILKIRESIDYPNLIIPKLYLNLTVHSEELHMQLVEIE
jgi:hypothetical protein